MKIYENLWIIMENLGDLVWKYYGILWNIMKIYEEQKVDSRAVQS